MRNLGRFGAIIGLAMVCATGVGADKAALLDYPALVERLTDLEHLAVLPKSGERCAQWSSWNRESQYDAATDSYVKWDTNGDGKGFIRAEGDQIVMAEMEGPGCIFRIWSARAQQGHVRIYIGGAEEPAVDLPFEQYFSGDTAPFGYPSLSYNLAEQGCRGQNLYFPIPYQKSCKVVADPEWGAYYQFTYTTFPKGTKVPSFSAELAAKNKDLLGETAAFLSTRLGESPTPTRPGESLASKQVNVSPGKSVVVTRLTGPRAITSLRAKTSFESRDDEMAGLRALALRITWDDETEPAVWCPLGDFFGTAPGENLYRTLPTGMTRDGYYAYWYMPFGVDFDAAGAMYIVELAGGRLHKRTPGGELETIAGNGSEGFAGDGGPAREAVFNGAHNLAAMPNGDLYIADSWNNRVRKIDGATGIITTFAGTGEAGFSGDGGPASEASFNFLMCVTLSADNSKLYLADLKNLRIRVIDLATGTITSVAGNGEKGVPEDGAMASDSPLADPRAVAADSKGNVYILERNGNALRKVTPAGRIYTVAGNGTRGRALGPALTAQLNSPKHLAVDREDNVYIADEAAQRICKYNAKAATLTAVLGAGVDQPNVSLKRPHGVCVHEDGSLYIADSEHHRILRVVFE